LNDSGNAPWARECDLETVMSRTKCIRVACLAVIFAAAAFRVAQALPRDTAQGVVGGSVLVVQSYNPEYVWCQEIEQGIRQALADTGAHLEILYLDAKRHPDPAAIKAAATAALERIRTQAPQVVITVDDAAQAYLTVPHLRGQAAPQVVFCGVNAPLETYGFPAANVTGVRERYHFREGFDLMRRIVPSAGRVVFLGEDSESMRYVAEDLRRTEAETGPYALSVVGVERCRTFQEWKQKVLDYQSMTDVFSFGPYNALTDAATGKNVSPDEVMAWTMSSVSKPTLGFSDIAKSHGMLCGILESGLEQGRLAGEMARQILATGTMAGKMPPRVNVTGVVMVNLGAAERLGVKIPYEIIEAAGIVLP
jgi:ABC-type uncharacterized transport system substrate-binding protein